MDRADRLAGVLLGCAVGDALGLPFEGLSRRRVGRMMGAGPLRYRFLPGRGMMSDDTEHICMTAQALLAQPKDPQRFARSLGWRLRFWLLGLPAGIGLGTLRAILKLWVGFPPGRSGVGSAGNGPAMRAPIIGACLAGQPDALVPFVRASTRLTHTDPRAEQGALAIALAAAHAVRSPSAEIESGRLFQELGERLDDPELRDCLNGMESHLQRGTAVREYADTLGLERGVSGFIYHTVPVALYAWFQRAGSFCEAVPDVIRLGGDTDTTGAIVGALAGAAVGASGLPVEWVNGILEWPRSIGWICRLADRLARRFPAEGTGERTGPLALFWPGLIARNLAFFLIVLAHGFRRALPPY